MVFTSKNNHKWWNPKKIKPHGYIPVNNTLGLEKYIIRPTLFTFVDDFECKRLSDNDKKYIITLLQ